MMMSGYATFSDNIFARRVGRWVSTACESSLYTHALMLVFSNDLLFLFMCEGQRTLAGISYFLPPCGSRGWTQVVRLGSEHLYSPNHLGSFCCSFLVQVMLVYLSLA